jgi:glucose-6-phosphate 1-epimerase
MDITKLNSDYGIAGQLKFVAGKGGFPCVEISNRNATALVCVYAGQVLSFRPTNSANDLLFVSDAAYYQNGKAIKGGIPVCWPWFGADPEGQGRAAHGFVRNRLWTVAATQANNDGDTRLTLALADSAETRAMWPHSFSLALEISVAETLSLELVTRNTGSEPFSITQALHTYFNVGDIGRVCVLGLENTAYLDKAGDGGQKIQTGPVTVAAEVDRIYTDVQTGLTIVDPGLQRRIRIASRGSKTAVVWNPWAAIAAQMGDLQDEDYRRFLCVETANAADDIIRVPADSEFRLQASYRIEPQAG